jgi:hypothetical protein
MNNCKKYESSEEIISTPLAQTVSIEIIKNKSNNLKLQYINSKKIIKK